MADERCKTCGLGVEHHRGADSTSSERWMLGIDGSTQHRFEAEGEGVTPLSVMDELAGWTVEEWKARLTDVMRSPEGAIYHVENLKRRLAEVEQELTTLRTALEFALVKMEQRGITYNSGYWRNLAADVRALLPATSTGDRPVPEGCEHRHVERLDRPREGMCGWYHCLDCGQDVLLMDTVAAPESEGAQG